MNKIISEYQYSEGNLNRILDITEAVLMAKDAGKELTKIVIDSALLFENIKIPSAEEMWEKILRKINKE